MEEFKTSFGFYQIKIVSLSIKKIPYIYLEFSISTSEKSTSLFSVSS